MPELGSPWQRLTVVARTGQVELEPYAAAIRGAERMERLKRLLADRADTSGVVGAYPRPPLYATRFDQGFETLYTAEYRPAEGAVRYRWPGQTWAQSLDALDPDSIQIRLGTP